MNSSPTVEKNNLDKQRKSMKFGIRARLFFGFSAVASVFIISMCITFYIVTTTKSYTQQVVAVNLPTYDSFLIFGMQIYQSQAAFRGYLISGKSELKDRYALAINEIDQIKSNIDALSNQWNDPDLSNDWNELKLMILNLSNTQNEVLSMKTISLSDVHVLSVMDKSSVILNKIFDLLDGKLINEKYRTDGLYDRLYKKISTETGEVVKDITTIQSTEIILSIVAIILSILIVYLTSKSIVRHINVFRTFSNKIASGDLRHTLDISTHDEIGELGNDLNIMTKSLSIITKQITEACHDMVSMLEEVRQAIDVQSSGATEQASSINEITSSLDEIEKCSTQTMEKAKALGGMAEITREKGQQGLHAVEESILGMKVIREKVQTIAQTILDLSNQTQQVGEITNLVNSLSQQSKMLALNASIEAAKAGEAGKGFAVVASEVKNLAEQSEQSTAQVQKILENIRHTAERAVMVTEEGTKGVDHGTDLVEQTGEAVRSLSEAIHQTALASQQIEAAVRQESVGIEQITTGMNEMNQVTSSFVTSVNQTLEAVNNLSDIARNLKKHIDTYKT